MSTFVRAADAASVRVLPLRLGMDSSRHAVRSATGSTAQKTISHQNALLEWSLR